MPLFTTHPVRPDLGLRCQDRGLDVAPRADEGFGSWTDTILGYDVRGRDHRIGKIEDLVVDDQTGDVRYLIVNTDGEESGRRVLLSPSWTQRISFSARTLYMDVSQEMTQDSPEWARTTPITREYETRLHDHYDRPAYWARGEGAAAVSHGFQGDRLGTSSFGSIL